MPPSDDPPMAEAADPQETGDAAAREVPEPVQAEDAFEVYMREGFDQIEGWPGRKASVLFLRRFRALFAEAERPPSVCEIGVHHGKYLIALHNIFGGRSLGIDLFEAQDKNVDWSGLGSRAISEANIARYAARPQDVTLLGQDSLDIRSREIQAMIDEYGYFAFFSIDGGHTPLHVRYDLATAAQTTAPNGIIAVDDIFHPDWPGVTEGVYQWLATDAAPFVPFLITRKKLFLCSLSVQQRYRDFVASERGDTPMKWVDFAGWTIPSLDFGSEY
jgi:hypothetical protein